MSLSEWIRIFDLYSYNNPDYAVAAYHLILGQILRKQRIKKGGRWLDGRFSVFILRDASSGKSAGTDPIYDVCEALGIEIVAPDDFSDASAVGTTEEIKQKMPDNTFKTIHQSKAGWLKDADIVHFDEATVIFKESQYAQKIKTFFQKCLNPIGSQSNRIAKKLAHGDWIRLRPHASLFLTSYLPETFEEVIINTGFLQRICEFPKDLSVADRIANSDRDIDLLGEDESVPTLAKIINEFKRIQKRHQKALNWKWKRAKPVLRNKVRGYYKLCDGISESAKKLMVAFIPRYQDMLYVLSMHYAAIRMDTNIGPQDVRRANDIIYPCLQGMLQILESTAYVSRITSKTQRKIEYDIVRVYRRLAKDTKDGFIGSRRLTEELQKLWRVSRATAYKRISSMGENVLRKRRGNAFYMKIVA